MKTESAQTNLYDIPLNRIDGSKTSLADYSGKVLLIVNVASKCGLTPQYEGLEKLYQANKDKGLEILGFPCNDFGEQEPGSESEIVSFCSTNYDVHFPLFSKVAVLGSDKHPLYKSLTEQKKDAIGEGPMREKLKKYGVQRENNADILWNFEKFLVDKHGKVVARFAPDVTADDERLLQAVQNELKA
jgi:glutathione peroxidase